MIGSLPNLFACFRISHLGARRRILEEIARNAAVAPVAFNGEGTKRPRSPQDAKAIRAQMSFNAVLVKSVPKSRMCRCHSFS
eukprot:2275266-Amphidinium_carterae.1